MDALLAYLPEDRVQALARGKTLPEQAHGAALFADISGFTPLTEAMTQALGPRAGVEALTDHINAVYAALIAAVERWRGSVISFSGDAITCWFDETDGAAPPRAAVCGLELQAAMEAAAGILLPGGRRSPLALKVAIATGPAHRLVVGDPAIQQIDALAGETIARMAAGEHLARPGEVLLDDGTAAALVPLPALAEPRADPETGERFTPLRALAEVSSPDPWPPVALGVGILRPWVLPAVWERHQAGLGAFLTELRPADVLFVRFGGLDFADGGAGAQLDALIRRAQAIVSGYGGALLQLTIGDKGAYLYAAFGAPVVHEDDARRAAASALALHAAAVELGLPPLQIGLSEGSLRCGAYGGPSRRTYGVLGDEVNLAARLMACAAPGETLVTSRARHALGDAFTLEPRPPILLKGKAEPLPAFALTGRARRRAVRLQEPDYTLPMVGRGSEQAIAAACLERALAGEGQVVVIEAEAGMGKSRLAAEVVRLARRRGCVGYGGAATASGTQTPYLAWRSIIQALLDVDPDAPLPRRVRLLAGELEDRVPQRAEALPLLDLLLDTQLPENEFTRTLSPQERKGAREALLVDLLLAAAREAGADGGALLLLLEDAHWLDPLSWELLERLAQEAAELPVLALLATRPADPHAPPPLAHLPRVTTIALDSLDESALEALIRAKLAQLFPARAVVLPTGLVSALAARSQGNPFYVEELLSYLRDRGVAPAQLDALAGLELPDSLHRLVLARVDQLAERERAALRVASIIGRLFHADWLRHLAPDLGEVQAVRADLEHTARLGLTLLDAPEPELRYLFRHVVTQEATYASLPQAMRARLHGALASWLESTFAHAPPLDLLAHHYDLSDRLDKRREYLRRAGEAAAAQYANVSAVSYLSRALAITSEDDVEERWALLWARETTYDLLGQRVGQAADLAALGELARGEPGRAADVALRLSAYHSTTGDLHACAAQAQRALELAGDDPARAAAARLLLGHALVLQGSHAEAQSQIALALGWARASGDRRVEILGLFEAGFAAEEPAARRAYYTEALALSRQHGDRQREALVLNNLGLVSLNLGAFAEARGWWALALAAYQRIGDLVGEAIIQFNLSVVRQRLGDYATAQAELEQSLRRARAFGHGRMEAIGLSLLGAGAFDQGDLAAAHTYFTQSLALSRRSGHRGNELEVLCELGYLALARGEVDAAIALFEEFVAQCVALQDDEPLDRAGLARALLARGDLQAATAQLAPILATIEQADVSASGWRLRAYLDVYEVLRTRGDERGKGLLGRLYAWLVAQAAPLDGATRQMFLQNVPTNRAIMRAWSEAQTDQGPVI